MSSKLALPQYLKAGYEPDEHMHLVKRAQGFLQEGQVAKIVGGLASHDDEKIKYGRFDAAKAYWPKTLTRETVTTRFETASKLQYAVNNTQKKIALLGGYKGMIALSGVAEKLGLFLRGTEFQNTITSLGVYDFQEPLSDTRGRIQLVRAEALELIETRPSIEDTSESVQAISKITHGLQLDFRGVLPCAASDPRERSRYFSHGLTGKQVQEKHSYPLPSGKAASTEDIDDRVLGLLLRHLKLYEEAQNHRPQSLCDDPAIVSHMITAEVSGVSNIKRQVIPEWFSKNSFHGTHGPIHPKGKTLFLSVHEEAVRQRIIDTIDQIADLIYEYPKQ